MSRFQIPGLDPVHEVFVGWDRPMATFFAQVYDRRLPEHRQILLWVGTWQGELCEIDELGDALREFASLQSEARRTLFRDHDRGL